jgi:FkbM family methyltransferase
MLAQRLGLSIQRLSSIPFGTRWEQDIAFYLGSGPHRFLDVGANEGQTAIRLLHQFPEAEIHSFEPVPTTFEQLTRRLAQYEGVKTINSAVGDLVGRSTLSLGAASGHNGFYARGPGVEVSVTTIDAYAKENSLGNIDLLKIDVEGHEPAVLRGATHLLRSNQIDFVLCECEFETRIEEPHGDFVEVYQLLQPLGYRIVAFYAGGVDELGWRWGDVLFRHVEHDIEPERVAVSPHG